MFDEEAERSRSHGLRPEMLAAQAERLGLRRITGRCTWQTYDAAFADALQQAKADAVTHVIFGDIMFDEHRQWAERMCDAAGLTAVEPLFGSSTVTLFEEWTASGADALIVTARAALLDDSWLGRPLRREMLDAFAQLGVDPCGERGEYHTVVTNTPLFSRPLVVEAGERVQRSGCWALDLVVSCWNSHASGLEHLVRLPAAAGRCPSCPRQRLAGSGARNGRRAARSERIGQDDAAADPGRRAAAAIGPRDDRRPADRAADPARPRTAHRGRAAGNAFDLRLQRHRHGADGAVSAPRPVRARGRRRPGDRARRARRHGHSRARGAAVRHAQRRREAARRDRERAGAGVRHAAARRADGGARPRLPVRDHGAPPPAERGTRHDDDRVDARPEPGGGAVRTCRAAEAGPGRSRRARPKRR